jgi:hypothetical protein
MEGKGDTRRPSLAFRAINAKMHDGMDIAFTGTLMLTS